MDSIIYFKCVKLKNKLRIRVISPGYNHEANCQFPRKIRSEGRLYSAPSHALSFSRFGQRGFFYRVKKDYVKIIDPSDEKVAHGQKEVKIKLKKIYETKESDCVVCLDASPAVAAVPCGHYCCCLNCSKMLNKCPLCRTAVTLFVTKDQIIM